MKPLLFCLALLLSSAAQAATCPRTSPAQDSAQAQSAALTAAKAALGTAYYGYAAQYRNISYQVLPVKTSVQGNAATVRGKITLRGTSRATGKAASNTLSGTVQLARVGCAWRMTGYQPG